jgi:hypothetical protein
MAMAQISKFLFLMIQNFLDLSTFSFESILIVFLTMPKSGVNTCPPVFRQSLRAKNNLHNALSKDEVNTSSAICTCLG